MKKIIISAFAILSIVSFSSCLKDKDFDNKRFGTIVEEIKAVSFPEATGETFDCSGSVGSGYQISPLSGSLNSQATPQKLSVTIGLEGSAVASAPVAVQINANNGLVTNYVQNCATGGLSALPSSGINFPSTVTIPAGERTVNFDVTFPNTSTLDLSKKYGVGLSMSSVSAGYQIVANKKDILLGFSIKNKYDGIYTLKGQFFHPSAAPGYPTFNTTRISMITTGPNSVKMFSNISGITGYFHPWTGSTGGAFTAFGSQEPEYTINTVTNAVTVTNSYPGAVTFYTMGIGYNNTSYNSRWDDASKTIYANFGYSMTGNLFNPAASRMFIDTLIRTGPRP